MMSMCRLRVGVVVVLFLLVAVATCQAGDDRGTAMALSFLVPGGGQFYVGDAGAGVGYLFGTAAAWSVDEWLGIGVYGYNIYDAGQRAERKKRRSAFAGTSVRSDQGEAPMIAPTYDPSRELWGVTYQTSF